MSGHYRRLGSFQKVPTVVGRILLPRNHRLRVEEGPVGTDFHVIDGTRLEVDVERAGNILAGASLGEEGREAAVAAGLGVLSGATVRLFRR